MSANKKQDDISLLSTILACFDNAEWYVLSIFVLTRDSFLILKAVSRKTWTTTILAHNIQQSRFILFGKSIILLKAIQSSIAGTAAIPNVPLSFPFNSGVAFFSLLLANSKTRKMKWLWTSKTSQYSKPNLKNCGVAQPISSTVLFQIIARTQTSHCILSRTCFIVWGGRGYFGSSATTSKLLHLNRVGFKVRVLLYKNFLLCFWIC